MTLHEVLNILKDKYLDKAAHNIGNDDLFNENVGRGRMCNELLKILSDGSLNTDVELKIDVLLKGD